jgi:hypothetical protein
VRIRRSSGWFTGWSCIVDAWASRDRTKYNSPGIEFDKNLIKDVIDFLLLQKPFSAE